MKATATLAAAIALIAAALTRVSAEEPRRLTLAATVDLALKVAGEPLIAGAAAEAAEARVRGAKAQRLPVLSTDASVTVWDKALAFDLGPGLPSTFDTTIRDQITSSVAVTLRQPISALLAISHLIGVERHGVRAARADLGRARLDAAARAAELWLRTLQAQAGQRLAEQSLAQIEGQLERARVLERGGALGPVDVLRLEAARDSVRLAALRAASGLQSSLRALAVMLNWPATTALELVDDLPDPPPAPPLDEQAAVAAAVRQRPELRAADERIGQAEEARKVALAGYLPNLMAVMSYQHNQGVGTLQPANAAYVGLTLQWDLWNWGKTGAGVDEAAQRRLQAQIGASETAKVVELDARRRALEAATAYQTLGVAATGLRAAEEAYRIQSVRFQQGAATTTDMLDAETEVARARNSALVARIEYFLALSNLARAAGEQADFSR